MRPRKAGGHVHVSHPGGEGALEDGHHELRIDRIHYQVGPMRSCGLGDRIGVARIDLDRREALGLADDVRDSPRAIERVVSEDHVLDPAAAWIGRDTRDCLPYRADTDEQHAHRSSLAHRVRYSA
jgi:hypothetical protein